MGEPQQHIHAAGGSISAGAIHNDVHLHNAAPPADPTIGELLSQTVYDTAEWLRTAAIGKAVHLLATAPVETAGRLLDTLLAHYPARVVVLLSTVENGRARQIVAAMRGGGGPVADVPEAAHAILRHASKHSTGRDLGPREGGLRRAVLRPTGRIAGCGVGGMDRGGSRCGPGGRR